MPIAYLGTLTTSTGSTSGATKTVSHTVPAGTDKILIAGLLTQTGGNADRVTGVTFNGVAMTRLLKRNIGTTAAGYVYYLINPDSTTANIVASLSPNSNCHIVAWQYEGVKQTGFPDYSAGQGGTPTFSPSFTTVADNAWCVVWGASEAGGSYNAGSSTNKRYAGAVLSAVVGQAFDGGPRSPAGSNSITINDGGSAQPSEYIKFSMAPVVTASAKASTVMMMGV